jgi:hypothetical protein
MKPIECQVALGSTSLAVLVSKNASSKQQYGWIRIKLCEAFIAGRAEIPGLFLANSKQLIPDIVAWRQILTYEHSFHATQTVPEVTGLHSPRGVACVADAFAFHLW